MIESLTINNWKAFTKKTFEFQNGVNFLVGKNGAGKTTVLEAICLALSGDTTHPNFLALIRDKGQPTTIDLNFKIGNDTYVVTRTFGHGVRKRSELKSNGRVISSSWDSVSQKIMALLGIETSFFKRLIYMPEGEIYRYIQEPPDDSLNKRIQYIFGIDKLIIIEDFIKRIRISFTNKIKETRIDLDKVQTIPKGEVEDLKHLEKNLEKLRNELNEKRNRMRDMEKTVSRFAQTKTQIVKAKDLSEQIIETVTDDDLEKIKNAPIKMLGFLVEKSHDTVSKIEKESNDTRIKIGMVRDRKKYLEDIKKLLDSLSEDIRDHVEVPCPVCERPITKDMGERLIEKTDNQIDQTSQELLELNKNMDGLSTALKGEKGIKSQRDNVRIRLEDLPSEVIENISEMSVSRMIEEIQSLEKKISDHTDEIIKIEDDIPHAEETINNTVQKISDIKSEQKKLVLKESLELKLVSAYKGEMIAGITESTLKNSVTDIRNIYLAPLFGLITDLWGKFRPGRKWHISPPIDGSVELKDEEKKYSYADLSGGEKTVLLILARVVICKALSKVGFLMIDEPLEHLDARNRRSLVNFLSMSSQKDVIPQLIVTTFEETLLRKYLYDENAKTEFLPYVG